MPASAARRTSGDVLLPGDTPLCRMAYPQGSCNGCAIAGGSTTERAALGIGQGVRRTPEPGLSLRRAGMVGGLFAVPLRVPGRSRIPVAFAA